MFCLNRLHISDIFNSGGSDLYAIKVQFWIIIRCNSTLRLLVARNTIVIGYFVPFRSIQVGQLNVCYLEAAVRNLISNGKLVPKRDPRARVN